MERYWRVHLNNTMATARMTLLGNYEAVVVGAGAGVGAGGQRCVNNTRERNYGTMFLNTRAEKSPCSRIKLDPYLRFILLEI